MPPISLHLTALPPIALPPTALPHTALPPTALPPTALHLTALSSFSPSATNTPIFKLFLKHLFNSALYRIYNF